MEDICEGVNFLYHADCNSGLFYSLFCVLFYVLSGLFYVLWHKIAIFKKTIFQEHPSTTASGTYSKKYHDLL